MSIEEYQMLKPRKRQSEIKDQFRAFRLEYDRLARKFTKKEYGKPWLDLESRFVEADKK